MIKVSWSGRAYDVTTDTDGSRSQHDLEGDYVRVEDAKAMVLAEREACAVICERLQREADEDPEGQTDIGTCAADDIRRRT